MVPYDVERLIGDIIAARVEEAIHALEQHAAIHGFPCTIETLLEPGLQRVGSMWSEGSISLAQGYVAGKITEVILDESIACATHVAHKPLKGKVIIGNIEDDFHDLGRRMLGAFLRLAGWQVDDLGNDVLASDFVDAAVCAGARVIGVSAMMLTTAMNIRSVRDELDSRGLGASIQLAVGGAVFRMRPALVAELGADGTADSAMSAPALFDRLLAKALAVAPQLEGTSG